MKEKHFQYKSNLLVVILLLVTIICTSCFGEPTAKLQARKAQIDMCKQQNERRTLEVVVKWQYGEYDLTTEHFNEGTIITLCLTNLACSNTSIFAKATGGIWSPQPANYTLAVGESTGPINYTLLEGFTERQGYIAYFVNALVENSNATVRMWYEVIYSAGKVSTTSTLLAFGSMILISAVCVLLRKRKTTIKSV